MQKPETKITRTMRVTDSDWYQLEVEAKRLGFKTRHAYIVDRLKIVPKTYEATEAA